MSDREKDKNKDRKLTLSVQIAGRGDGTVKSTVKGIDCDHDCDQNFSAGTVVELKATPDDGSTFTGWTGACVGTSTCTVTLDSDKDVTATFARIPRFDLTVTLAGNGTGTVTSSPNGISCRNTAKHGGDDDGHGNKGKDGGHGGDCHDSFLQGSVVLTATGTGGSAFLGWGGACSGVAPTCTVTLTEDASVTATFGTSVPLTVVKAGTGTGTVTSVAAGIACGLTCTAPFASGSTVVLTALADAGSIFTGWSGAACPGTGTCSVTMSAATSVTATFQKTYTLTVNVVGANGKVTSSPAGINCTAGACSQAFAAGTVVTLTAAAASASRPQVITWSSCPVATSGAICTFTMPNADVSATATFTDLRYAATVTLASSGAGTGAGSVVATSAEPLGFTCPGVCTQNFLASTLVTLTATPDANSAFVGFTGGGCPAGPSTTCVLTMDAAKNDVKAIFQSSVVTLAFIGAGRVLSSPQGVSCTEISASCVASFGAYGPNAQVVLTATAAVNYAFDHWTVDGVNVSTSTADTLTVNGAKLVTATFIATTPPPSLTLTITVVGGGDVLGLPGGDDCFNNTSTAPRTCGPIDISTATITLTADGSQEGTTFLSWGGDGCKDTTDPTKYSTDPICVVTMTGAKSVTANFTGGPVTTASVARSESGPSLLRGINSASVTTRAAIIEQQR